MNLLTKALLQATTALALVAALPAQAQPASAPAAGTAPDPNRLFPDSQMIVRDRISVEVSGKGPDLVFVPGLASSRQTWRATAERLRAHYRLHLVPVAASLHFVMWDQPDAFAQALDTFLKS